MNWSNYSFFVGFVLGGANVAIILLTYIADERRKRPTRRRF
jgi:hypothetical protein